MPVHIRFEYSRTRAGANRPPRVILEVPPGDDVAVSELSPQGNASNMSGGAGGSNAPGASTVSASHGTMSLAQLLPKGSYALPTFSGKPSDRNHAAAFLDRLQKNLALQPNLTDAHKLVAIHNCFPIESPAGAWYLSSSRNFATFGDFESAFVSRFGASDIDISYNRRQFRRFRQRDSDSVSKYHNALLDLVARISLLGNPPSEEDISEQFVNGLKPDLSDLVFHEQIRAGRKYSLDELVRIAEDIERTERAKRKSNVRSAPQFNAVQHTGKWCVYHKATSHNTDDCKRVKELKAAGKWKGASRNKQPNQSNESEN